MESGGCSFTAEIRADLGEHCYEFSIASHTEQGQSSLEVLAPEAIAGISAVVSADGTELQFEDAELDFGQLAEGRVSAVTAPWLLTYCWEQAYIAWSGPDGEQERVTYLHGYDADEVAVDTWFSNGVPTYAEVTFDQVRCLTAVITDFQWNA